MNLSQKLIDVTSVLVDGFYYVLLFWLRFLSQHEYEVESEFPRSF